MINKTTIRNITIMILFLSVAFSCGGGKTILRADLNLALRLSAENRPELEKVLRHYSINEEDSLKLRAAKFLISNMIRHYSVGGEYIDGYMKLVDSVYADQPLAVRNIYYMLATRANSTSHLVERQLDLQTIKADLLIKNIDYSFGLWQNGPHLRSLSFDDFCEYILPYNVNHEPLREWKDSSMFMRFKMKRINDYVLNLEQYDDLITFSTSDCYYSNTFTSPDSLIGVYRPDCIDQAYNEVMIKRSMGIPATVDYVPHFPASENRHYWVVVMDEKFWFKRKTTYKCPYVAKVYRKTYSINPIPEDLENFVPDILRDPYSKDVTEEYEKIITVEYKFDDIPSGVKYGYLAVFNNLNWKEVAWSKLRCGKLKFEKMGREVMYMPTYYNGKSQLFGKYPIYVNVNGEVKEVIPNKKKTQTVTLKRKFPYTIYGEFCGESFLGSTILASNNLKGLKFDTLAMINSYWNMAYDTVHIKSVKKYKNWFVKVKKGEYLTISELQFFNKSGELLKGNHFCMNGGVVDTIARISEKIFDNDLLTSALVTDIVGVSFDEPVAMSHVKYTSKNDENGIYPTNEYELFYFDNGAWVSLGRKVASGYSINYDNVPSNALLWLHNLTKGKEERPFMINNGKVKFW